MKNRWARHLGQVLEHATVLGVLKDCFIPMTGTQCHCSSRLTVHKLIKEPPHEVPVLASTLEIAQILYICCKDLK